MKQTRSIAETERFVSRIFQRRSLLLALLIHLFVFVAAPTYSIKTIPPPATKIIEIEHVYEPPDEFDKIPVEPRPPIPIEEADDEDIPEDREIAETILEYSRWAPESPPPILDGSSVFHVSYDQKPVPLRLVRPEYPEIARIGNISGTVYVKLLIGKDGRVQNIEILEGPEIFHETVINAARDMEFKPAQSRNRPVAVWITMPFHFSLQDAN